jgi:5'-phosphate synthase pdxT subunit
MQSAKIRRTDKIVFSSIVYRYTIKENRFLWQRWRIQLTEVDNKQRSIKDALLGPNGPHWDDDFLALCGTRNRRLVERLRAEEDTANSDKTKALAKTKLPIIGVLAIQGNFASHAQALTEAGASAFLVKTPDDLRLDGKSLDGLVLPGGESTTMLKFLEKHRFFEALQHFCGVKPVFGTCAGTILLAREVLHPAQRSLGLLDAVVERNAYGRQIDSTIITTETALPGGPLEMVFIRAPRILSTGPGVEVLARRDGYATLVRQGHIFAATFHPELSRDRRVHRLFVTSVAETSSQPAIRARITSRSSASKMALS